MPGRAVSVLAGVVSMTPAAACATYAVLARGVGAYQRSGTPVADDVLELLLTLEAQARRFEAWKANQATDVSNPGGNCGGKVDAYAERGAPSDPMSAKEAGDVLHRTASRIRQLARKETFGHKSCGRWSFTAAEVNAVAAARQATRTPR